jgi:hypothetical protein
MELTLSRCREILTRTPAVLRALLSGLGDHWTTPNYGEGTWSAHDIVAHLINCERTDWIPRVRSILEGPSDRTFPPFDRQGYLAEARTKPLSALLDEFEHCRRETLAALDSFQLTEADLGKQGLHPALGPATLRNLLATWTVHDLNHISQICKAMAYQYKEQVGPWQAYLSILSPPSPR